MNAEGVVKARDFGNDLTNEVLGAARNAEMKFNCWPPQEFEPRTQIMSLAKAVLLSYDFTRLAIPLFI